MRGFSTLNMRGTRPRASGDNNSIRLHLFRQSSCYRLVQPNGNTGQLHFAFEIGDDTTKLGATGQTLRQQNLASQLRSGLEQGHLMSTRSGNGGSLHPRWSTARDNNPPSCHGRR